MSIITSSYDRSAFAGTSSNQEEAVAIDCLKLSHAEWIDVVEQIKRIRNNDRDRDPPRQHARAEALGLLKIVIEIRQPGGTNMRLLARSHDISTRGLGFIHGMYLYPESECVCWMRHASKGMTPIEGTIRWCRHVSGRVHMSGVQLNEIIKVEDYLTY